MNEITIKVMPKRQVTKRDITEAQFLALLGKASQPINATESDLAPLETSDILPDGDCSETDTHLNKTVDTSG